MTNGFLGEFMGTMVLILLGNGVVANVLLKRSKAEGAGWLAITTGWGFAVTIGVFTAKACGSPGANLNPAITLGSAIVSGDYSRLAPFAAAQLLGALAGALLVWIHFQPHWQATEDADVKLGCFATAPAIRAPLHNFVGEAIGAFVLVLGAAAIFARTSGDIAPGLGPYLVGVLVWSIGLSLGGTTGYAINPARDFGPRIMHAILPMGKKGSSDWSYAPIPILGPLAGAAVAALVARAVHL